MKKKKFCGVGESVCEKVKNIATDKKGQTLILVGIILAILLIIGFLFLSAIVLTNLEGIGKGILYLALAVLVIVGVAILAKRFLFGGVIK